MDELKATTEKLNAMRNDLKDALKEIEDRGNRIAALEGVGRGLADLVSETFLPKGGIVPAAPYEQVKMKAKKLLIGARSLEIF
jgi:hypothetical protein